MALADEKCAQRSRDASRQAPRVTCQIQRGRGRGKSDQKIRGFALFHENVAAQNLTFPSWRSQGRKKLSQHK